MHRIPGPVTEKDVQRWLREGQGTGDGPNYLEWIGIRAFSSQGETSRIPSSVTGMSHTVFSKTEKGALLAIEFSRNVKAIHTQRRLERPLTLAAASRLDVAHPQFPGTAVNYVMSVDALVRHKQFAHARWSQELEPEHRDVPENLVEALKDSGASPKFAVEKLESWGVLLRTYDQLLNAIGKWQWAVYDSKLEADLLGERTLEKLSISRLASQHNGWRYFIVTDKTLPDQLVFNIEWVRRGDRKPLEVETPPGLFSQLPGFMLADLPKQRQTTFLQDYCSEFDNAHALPAGTGLRVLQHLLWHHHLRADLRVPHLEEQTVGHVFPRLQLVKRSA